MHVLILGCGYLGGRVAQRWLGRGDVVTAVTRSPDRAARLAEAGLRACVGDITDAASLAELPSADLVLYAVGYDRNAAAGRGEVVVDGLRNALAALENKTRRLVFISTSSVYGVADGGWVDEATPAEPAGESGRLALEAERLVAAGSLDTICLRLTGLYGPGRLLRRVDQFRRREPVAGEGEAWLNLIHVDDASRAVELAADRLLGRGDRSAGGEYEMFLVTDDRPMRRRAYYEMLARAAGAAPPIFDPDGGASRIVGLGKRCRNVRMKGELGLALEYPRVTESLLRSMVAGGSHSS